MRTQPFACAGALKDEPGTGGGTLSERELVRRVVERGDESAFRALYDRHTPKLLGLALQLTAGVDRVLAEDVVHEAWLRAVSRLHAFGWQSELGTWLGGIVVNTAREARREPDVARTTLADGSLSAASTPSAERPVDARIDVERALAALPPGRRMVLVLHDLQGYRHTEIAELLGITVGTSKRQLHDARHELERILSREVDHA